MLAKVYSCAVIGLEGAAVAASGGHNLLMNGSPGSGKTLMARVTNSTVQSYHERISHTNEARTIGLLG